MVGLGILEILILLILGFLLFGGIGLAILLVLLRGGGRSRLGVGGDRETITALAEENRKLREELQRLKGAAS
jgi:hypothetical protein